MKLFYFVLMVGPLVFFHELGHLVAAKRFGVKCLSFSIGVGPVVARFVRGGTEYAIRLLPLGGYVSMLGAHPDEAIEPEDRGRSLTDKPIWQRALVYLAGPAMNILLPVPVFMLFFATVDGRLPSVVGDVNAGSPAQEAGLRAGDDIVAINGADVRFFDELGEQLTGPEPIEIRYVRDGSEASTEVTPRAIQQPDPLAPWREETRYQLGILAAQYGSIVHVDAATPAHDVGLRTFDEVVAVDDTTVDTFVALRAALRDASGSTSLRVLRPVDTHEAWAHMYVEAPVELTFDADVFRAAGGLDELRSAQLTVFGVHPGTPAHAAGFERADRIVAIDDAPHTIFAFARQALYGSPNVPKAVEIDRAGTRRTLTLEPHAQQVEAEFRQVREHVFVGLDVRNEFHMQGSRPMDRLERARFAVGSTFREIWRLIAAILIGVVSMLYGAVDTSSLGGPLMMGDIASRAARDGWQTFVQSMCLISINLGILNLLPIPGLDGGQLTLLTMEGFKRGPLSMRARQLANFAGLAFILMLMLLVMKNDIERYWGDFANAINTWFGA